MLPSTALRVGRPEPDVAESAVRGVQRFFTHHDGDLIASSAPCLGSGTERINTVRALG